MENTKYMNIPKEKFRPVTDRDVYHDKKLETKPIGYFKDAWIRFRKNKGSVVAFGIIVFLLLFAILAPMISPYTVSYEDEHFRYNYPKNQIWVDWGLDFWDGCAEKTANEVTFLEHCGIAAETGKLVVKNNGFSGIYVKPLIELIASSDNSIAKAQPTISSLPETPQNSTNKPEIPNHNDQRFALLIAIKPYLGHDRQNAIDYILKLSHLGSILKNL